MAKIERPGRDGDTVPTIMSCGICFEDYKGKKVIKVTCQYCPAHACRGCQQRYLLQSYEDPHCLECKRGWTEEFMAANFPLSFRNDTLRKHRRKILFEREKALLPAMQVFVELKKEMEGLTKQRAELEKGFSSVDPEENTIHRRFRQAEDAYYKVQVLLNRARNRVQQLKTERAMLEGANDAVSVRARNDLDNELQEARNTRAQLRLEEAKVSKLRTAATKEYRDRSTLLTENNRLYWRVSAAYNGNGQVDGVATRERREFIMKCGAEDCRGFLASSYKCGTCSKWTCPDCLVVLGEDKSVDHTCKAEEVESAKAIKKETRPCPKCGARIFKIDGCDQMWCTVEGCGTAFSWQSGHIVTGRVHNPHYYEWLRRNGGGQAPREAGDIPCGGLPNYWTLLTALRTGGIFTDLRTPNAVYAAITGKIDAIHRKITELVAQRLPAHPARPVQLANKDLDVRYLMNELSEEEWKRQLEITEARFNRKKEIGQILQMAATASSDMFSDLLNRLNAVTAATRGAPMAAYVQDIFFKELDQLRTYVNESLQALGKRNHMAVPQLDDDWGWKPSRILYKAKKGGAAAAAATDAEAEVADEVPPLIDDAEIVEAVETVEAVA